MATEFLEQVSVPERLTRRAATLEEFRSLPESMLPTEYVNGEILISPAPTPLHQLVSANLFTALNEFVRKASGGRLLYSPADVVLPSSDVVQPDIFLLAERDVRRSLTAKRIHAVPPFLVEILSPGTATHDTLTKRNLYEQNGVREYWIVDPEARGIAQLILRKKHYALTELSEDDSIKSVVLSGFEMNVGRLLGCG